MKKLLDKCFDKKPNSTLRTIHNYNKRMKLNLQSILMKMKNSKVKLAYLLALAQQQIATKTKLKILKKLFKQRTIPRSKY